jgi:phytoene dehydrogenase-like protein
MTISTHTAAQPWWDLMENNPQTYAARKEEYTFRCLAAAERAVPGLKGSIRLCMPATPITFQFYTGRKQGLVGGYPQTSLFRARGPRTSISNLFLVGDSIFPGQSTAAVTLGALRVAAEIEANPNL